MLSDKINPEYEKLKITLLELSRSVDGLSYSNFCDILKLNSNGALVISDLVGLDLLESRRDNFDKTTVRYSITRKGLDYLINSVQKHMR